MAFIIDPKTALAAGTTLYENRARLLPLLRRLHFRLTRGTLRVAVFGPGGVGKTTLGQLLSSEGGSVKPGTYRESLDVERKAIAGCDIVGGLIIAPGQERRIEVYWPDLYRSLAAGNSRGVINVVSYGYHSFAGLGFQETAYYRQGMTAAQFLTSYQAACRDRELEIIEELAPRLADARRKIWMMTLVTKQDLWWKDRAAVEAHYRSGAYDGYIQQVTQKRGAQNFTHEYVSASLVMSNFVDGKGEELAPTTGGYDQNLQQAHMQHLIEMVQTLAKR